MRSITVLFFFLVSSCLFSQENDSLKMDQKVDSLANVYLDEGLDITELKAAFIELKTEFTGVYEEYLDLEEQIFISTYFSDHNLREFAWQNLKNIEEKARKINYKSGIYGVYEMYSYLNHLDGENEMAVAYADSVLKFYEAKEDPQLLITPLIGKSIVVTDTTEVFRLLHLALRIALETQDIFSINTIYHNLSYEYLSIRKLDSAEHYIH